MSSKVRVSIAAVCLVVATGCVNSPTVGAGGVEAHASHAMSPGPVSLTADVNKDLAALRALTARYNRFDVAKAEGWSTQITPCFESAGVGGMGFHYGNTALIDGKVNVLEPELLLYEPQKDGTLRFVAVEYIVPLDAWTAEQPPKLFGQEFHRNDTFKIWALHVWHVRNNPRGMFADWNPQVSCASAG